MSVRLPYPISGPGVVTIGPSFLLFGGASQMLNQDTNFVTLFSLSGKAKELPPLHHA
jgi:hypothetical protein